MRVVNYTIVGSNHSNETYVFSGLQEYTVYEFSVAAHTSIGEGISASVSARTFESGLLNEFSNNLINYCINF